MVWDKVSCRSVWHQTYYAPEEKLELQIIMTYLLFTCKRHYACFVVVAVFILLYFILVLWIKYRVSFMVGRNSTNCVLSLALEYHVGMLLQRSHNTGNVWVPLKPLSSLLVPVLKLWILHFTEAYYGNVLVSTHVFVSLTEICPALQTLLSLLVGFSRIIEFENWICDLL